MRTKLKQLGRLARGKTEAGGVGGDQAGVTVTGLFLRRTGPHIGIEPGKVDERQERRFQHLHDGQRPVQAQQGHLGKRHAAFVQGVERHFGRVLAAQRKCTRVGHSAAHKRKLASRAGGSTMLARYSKNSGSGLPGMARFRYAKS